MCAAQVSDFSAEDFAAWQQLNTQWREIQQSDEAIALAVAELDEEEQVRPGLSEDAAEVATEGLCRQVSVAKYDQMLQHPTLAEDKRAQVLAMREKRLARELGSFTEEERAEWEYLEQLSQQMAATDESIAQVLSEPTAAERAAEVDAEPADVERSLLSAGVDSELLQEHERAAEEIAAQEADAAIAAVVESETAADAAANTEEVQDMPWEPIDGITPEMVTEHEEQVARRLDADATFAVDSTMVRSAQIHFCDAAALSLNQSPHSLRILRIYDCFWCRWPLRTPRLISNSRQSMPAALRKTRRRSPATEVLLRSRSQKPTTVCWW